MTSTIVLLILTVFCPQLAVIFMIGYALYKDNEEAANNALGIILVGFILIGAPIVTFLSVLTFGFEDAMDDGGWFLALITLAEMICIFAYFINKFKLSHETDDERQERIANQQAKAKQQESELKNYRLNKSFNINDKHVCNLTLYDQCSEGYKADMNREILCYISKGKSLSKETWEIYYYRILVREPSPQELFDIRNKHSLEFFSNNDMSYDESHKRAEIFESDWDKDWLTASIKWNVDLGQYNWMKTSSDYNHSIHIEKVFESDNKNDNDAPNDTLTMVVVTSGGKKYHSSTDCLCIKGRKNLIQLPLDDAKNKGYTSCNVCYNVL